MEKGTSDNTNDWYFTNGQIWDPVNSIFKPGELVVRDGRIEEIIFKQRRLSGSLHGAEKIDLEGGYVCPGFIDSHMHLSQWAITRNGLDLSGCRSKDEIMQEIRSVLDGRATNPIFEESDIIFGRDYDDSNYRDGLLNDGRFLENEFPDIPIVVRRICGHKALANTEGMSIIGVLEEGTNNVVLEDGAMGAPWKLPLKDKILSKFLSDAIDHLYSMGVVGGVDIIPLSQFNRMASALSRTNRKLFLSASIIRDSAYKSNKKVPPTSWKEQYGNSLSGRDDIPVVFDKIFLDGSIGSRTASFSYDYSDADRTPLIMGDDLLREKVQQSSEDGLIPMIHCIGDSAISQAVGVIEELKILYRLEHAEAIDRKNLNKMKGGKGTLSIQPNFQMTWGQEGGLYNKSLGKHYLDLNPFRTIANSGILWCFGTDMMPPDPLYAIHGSIGHPNPQQRLRKEEALTGFTGRSSELSFISDQVKNNFCIGSLANIIIVDGDFRGIKFTYLNGKMVYLHHN
jgi:predicted amidohydrolase YtcJ